MLVGLAAITSCATEARFERWYSSWIGSDIEKLEKAWGKPQYINQKPNGIAEYGYNLSLSKKKPLPDTCILYFNFDKSSGVILSIRHEGGRCKVAPSFV